VISVVFQVVYILIYVFVLSLFARFIMAFVMQYGRRWRPGRGSSATLELLWSVTDPPLKALRRVIPPLRVGTVAVDLSSIVLLVILFVMMNVVVEPLIRQFS
jgi:YggT family protein